MKDFVRKHPKVGDILLCKKDYVLKFLSVTFFSGNYYRVLKTDGRSVLGKTIRIGGWDFTIKEINKYFTNTKEERKLKLKKLQDFL